MGAGSVSSFNAGLPFVHAWHRASPARGFRRRQEVGDGNISIRLLPTTGWEVSLVRHPKQDDGVRFAVIKCHDCKITKARGGNCSQGTVVL